MTAVTVSPKFQVVISKAVRERLDIRPGQKLQVLATSRVHRALLWTQDPDLEDLTDVEYLPRA